jgi:hypothetical protein
MLQHPHRPQCIPTAGAARFFHIEMDLSAVFGLHGPCPIFTPFLAQDVEGFFHTQVLGKIGRLKIHQRAQNVVEPAAGVGEHQKALINDFARAVGTKEAVLQDEFA